jgi:cytochrome b
MAALRTTTDKVRAWDIPTRLFHWTLVLLIFCSWASFEFAEKLGDTSLKWHRWNGYAILVLVVFRLLWGFVGSSTSRFVNFVRWPWVAAGYGLDLLRGRDRHFLGHNPLGTYMVLALLALVAGQGILGLYTLEHNDLVAGPLKITASEEWVKRASYLHVRGFNVILAFAALHVLANVLYGVVKKDPLITAMITGKKPADDYEDEAEARLAGSAAVRALICLAVAAGIVFGGITALGGKIL